MLFDDMDIQAKTILSNKIKKKLGFFSGLYWAKTNTGGFCFSRHWPHIITWTWTLWFEPQWKWKHDGVWVKKDWPIYFFQFSRYHETRCEGIGWTLNLFWLLRISFMHRTEDWMISENPRYANLLIPNAIRNELFLALGDENIGWPV